MLPEDEVGRLLWDLKRIECLGNEVHEGELCRSFATVLLKALINEAALPDARKSGTATSGLPGFLVITPRTSCLAESQVSPPRAKRKAMKIRISVN